MSGEDIKMILSAIGIVVSFRVNRKAKNANKISQVGVDKIEESNRISEEANSTTARALEISKRENMSRFTIEIRDIEWNNDGFLCDKINEVLIGTFKCRFKGENLSIRKALFMVFKKESSQLRSKGVHVSGENCIEMEHYFFSISLIRKEPIV